MGLADLAMLFRAILSWFIDDEESRLWLFLVAVTEPFILPFRYLLGRFSWVEEAPMDVPFFAAFLTIGILQAFLPALT